MTRQIKLKDHNWGLEVDVEYRGQEDQVEDGADEAGREAGDCETSGGHGQRPLITFIACIV